MNAQMEQQTVATESEQTPLIDSNVAIFEEISGSTQYRWIDYFNFRVIEDIETGYINATKMCAMYATTKGGKPKQFAVWKPYNQQLIDVVATSLKAGDLIMMIVNNGANDIRGTYVHRDLVAHIALWCGITITDSEILEMCIKQQNQVKKQKVPMEGFVYVLSAPMFSYYGDNVYKIGYTENLK